MGFPSQGHEEVWAVWTTGGRARVVRKYRTAGLLLPAESGLLGRLVSLG